MKNPIRGNALTRVLATVLLAGTLSTAALVRAQADPFAVAVPTSALRTVDEAEIQAMMNDMSSLLDNINAYVEQLLFTTEQYRNSVNLLKQLVASCEVVADISGYENSDFAGFLAEGPRQCLGWIETFDHNAMIYAAELDQAMQFQRLLEQVGNAAQGRIDSMRIVLQQSRVDRAVSQGAKVLDESKATFRPWMER